MVIKSTVPVGTSKEIKDLIGKYTKRRFHLVNNPEFLKEGTAVEDFRRPDRVIIGHADPEAALVMEELYAPLVRQGNPILKMSNLSAEAAKYTANCFSPPRFLSLMRSQNFVIYVVLILKKCGVDHVR